MKSIEVVAAVIVKEDKIFCAQRGSKGETAYKWEFPGGKIEAGETHKEALIREIKEELDSLIFVCDYIMTVIYQYNSFQLTMHAYFCELIEGKLSITEHIDAKWVKAEKLSELDFAAADIPIIEKLACDVTIKKSKS